MKNSIYTLFLLIILVFSCEDLEEGIVICPELTQIIPSTAESGDLITLAVANMRAIRDKTTTETYELLFNDTPFDTNFIESFDLANGTITVEIPRGLGSGEFSVRFAAATGFDTECTSSGMLFEYTPSVRNFSVLISSSGCQDLCRPAGIDVDQEGRIYVADINNNLILQIAPGTGELLQVLGDKDNPGCESNVFMGEESTFFSPIGLAIDQERGELFVSGGSCLIRKVNISNSFSTFEIAGQCGNCSGINTSEALFQTPQGLEVAADGTVLVADFSDNIIRSLSPTNSSSNDYDLGVFAGKTSIGVCASEDGLAEDAVFCQLKDIEIDNSSSEEITYVLEFNSNMIRRIDQAGAVTTLNLTSIAGAALQNPAAITSDGRGNLYIADPVKQQVFRVDLAQLNIYTINEIVGLSSPEGVAFDRQNNILYVSDRQGGKIVQVEIE